MDSGLVLKCSFDINIVGLADWTCWYLARLISDTEWSKIEISCQLWWDMCRSWLCNTR